MLQLTPHRSNCALYRNAGKVHANGLQLFMIHLELSNDRIAMLLFHPVGPRLLSRSVELC